MRILLACEFYHPSVGGVQEVMRQIAEHLAGRGHRVTVATSHLPQRQVRELNGVRIVEFKASGNLAGGLTGEVDAYRNYVLQADYDVFMVKAAQQWTFDALLPVLDRMAGPKICVPCGFSGLYDPAFAEYFRGMPEALRKFDHLIFYASDYRDINFAREHGLANFSIVPNGASEREFAVPADPGFRRRHGIEEDAFVVLTVGSLTGRKGHHELAEAFARVRFPDRPTVLILNGNIPPWDLSARNASELPGTIASLYKTGGVLKLCKWITKELLIRARLGWVFASLGYDVREPLTALVARINRAAPAKRALLVNLARAEVVQAYLNSDLFVFASNIEYSPLVLYEAAAAGLPFLSVPVGNAAEIAQWTGGGAICPARIDAHGYTRVDPAVLAEHIERLAADPAALAALGEAGSRNWSQQFTWEKITDQYAAIFTRLLREKQAHDGST